MNKQFGVVLVLITLASLGFAIYEQAQLRRARLVVAEDLSGDPPPESSTATVAAASIDANSVQALQRQVASLQAERDKLRAELTAAQAAQAARAKPTTPVVPTPVTVTTNAARRASFDDRMAQLKTEDPARYAEMQKQRDDFRQRLQTQADERAEYLKNVDITGLTDEQRANHEKLLQAVEQARATMAQIATLSPEDAAAARQQMAATMGAVADLYQQERRALLEQAGRAMEYQQDADIAKFADYIQQICDQTTLPRGFGGGRGGRPANTPVP